MDINVPCQAEDEFEEAVEEQDEDLYNKVLAQTKQDKKILQRRKKLSMPKKKVLYQSVGILFSTIYNNVSLFKTAMKNIFLK